MSAENITENEIKIQEDSNKPLINSDRIESLDVTRGLAMILIIALHYALPWFHENSLFIAGIGQLILEFLGPSMFIILSTVSVVFNVKRKQEKWSEKAIRKNTFMRGLMIIIIGFIYSLFSAQIWVWNILMFIGFGQIFTYYAIKLDKIPRIIIGIVILLTSEIIREFFWVYQHDNAFYMVVNFLISSPSPDITILPWLSVCFIVPVFGEMIYDLFMEGTQESYHKLFRNFIIWGCILLLVGIIVGFELKAPSDLLFNTDVEFIHAYPYIELLNLWNLQSVGQVPQIPKFLITGTSANILFNLGLDLLIIAFFFNIIDMKKKRNVFFNMLKFFGSVSLTLFLIEYIFIPLYIRMFAVFPFFLFVWQFIGFLGILMFIWARYYGQVGTPEWLVGFILKGKNKPEGQFPGTNIHPND